MRVAPARDRHVATWGPMTSRWKSCVVVVGVLGLVACSGDDGDSTSTTTATGDAVAGSFAELAAAPADSCPVAFGDAVSAAGIDDVGDVTGRVNAPDAATDDTEDTTAAGDTTPLERLEGVEVSCFATTDGGDAHLLLLAGQLDEPGSTALALFPQLARVAGLTSTELEPIAAAVTEAEPGTPFDLPGDASAALVRTSIDGAADAAYLVWSDGLTRDQVNAIATEVDAVLP